MDWRDDLILLVIAAEVGLGALAIVLAFTISPLVGIAIALPTLVGAHIVGRYL